MIDTNLKQKREAVLGSVAWFLIVLATICSVALTAAFVAVVVWPWKAVLAY